MDPCRDPKMVVTTFCTCLGGWFIKDLILKTLRKNSILKTLLLWRHVQKVVTTFFWSLYRSLWRCTMPFLVNSSKNNNFHWPALLWIVQYDTTAKKYVSETKLSVRKPVSQARVCSWCENEAFSSLVLEASSRKSAMLWQYFWRMIWCHTGTSPNVWTTLLPGSCSRCVLGLVGRCECDVFQL